MYNARWLDFCGLIILVFSIMRYALKQRDVGIALLFISPIFYYFKLQLDIMGTSAQF